MGQIIIIFECVHSHKWEREIHFINSMALFTYQGTLVMAMIKKLR